MFNESNLDPMAVASLLDALAESLRDPSGGPKTPGDLGNDLAKMVDVTRKWAADHDIPPACIPEAPGGDVTNARAAEFLTDLAKVVRYLGPHATPLENMSEVVELLKARQAPALIELSEFDFAIKELLPNFIACEETLGAVCAEITAARILDRETALRDSLDHAHDSLRHLVVAFNEVCKGVRGWGLVSIRSEPPPASSARPS